MKNVKDYNNLLNEAKKVRPEEIEDYFTSTNSGKMLDKIFKGKFDEEKFRNFLGDILDRAKRIESVIKIWSGYFGLNPKDYTSGEFIEDVMFLDDITVAAKEAYGTFVKMNEGEIDFSDKSIPGRKALPIKQVAELIKKASKEDVDKLLKTLTKKQVKDMEGMKKGGGSDAGSLAAILTDEKGQPRIHWLKNRLSEYVNEGNDFAGWVAIYNNNRIEIDKSEADGIYQAKQIAIKKLKVPKSKVGLLAIAPGYNESMHEAKEDKLYKSIDALEKEARKILAPIEIGSFIAQLDDLRQFLQGNVVLEKQVNEGKNDYSARFGKTDITIKNGHKLTDEDSLYDMYEKIGKVIKDSGLDLGSVIIKESQSVNEGEITDYVTALGTVVAQVMADHPKLGKYHEMKGKRGFIKLQELKDLPEKELIALANSL